MRNNYELTSEFESSDSNLDNSHEDLYELIECSLKTSAIKTIAFDKEDNFCSIISADFRPQVSVMQIQNGKMEGIKCR